MLVTLGKGDVDWREPPAGGFAPHAPPQPEPTCDPSRGKPKETFTEQSNVTTLGADAEQSVLVGAWTRARDKVKDNENESFVAALKSELEAKLWLVQPIDNTQKHLIVCTDPGGQHWIVYHPQKQLGSTIGNFFIPQAGCQVVLGASLLESSLLSAARLKDPHNFPIGNELTEFISQGRYKI